MGRTLSAGPLCVALILYFLQAPVFHIHSPGRAERHVSEKHAHGIILHTHLPAPARSAVPRGSVASDDASAQALDRYQAEKQSRLRLEVAKTVWRISDPGRFAGYLDTAEMNGGPNSAAVSQNRPRAPPA